MIPPLIAMRKVNMTVMILQDSYKAESKEANRTIELRVKDEGLLPLQTSFKRHWETILRL